MTAPAQQILNTRSGAGATVGLCFLVAVLEGLDIQAMGVAAPALGAELKLAQDVLGRALAASNIGLVVGASLGGWLADRLGRKPVLISAAVLFGVFTLATMTASNYEGLFAVRLGAGLGFGAALPNIMAMAAELSRPERRASIGTMMFCGMPVGGGIMAAIAWLAPNQNWRTLFLIGGVAPLLMSPALIFLMRETHSPSRVPVKGNKGWTWVWLPVLYAAAFLILHYGVKIAGASALAIPPAVVIAYAIAHRGALFGEGRGFASVLLWIVFLPTLLVLYLILNWLPTLVLAKGFPRAEASQASVWFNAASAVGALLFGRLVDRFGVRWPLVTCYAALIGALLALAQADTLIWILSLSATAGFFLIGANYALYGAAAAYYPAAVRGRGSGAAIAWGRLGSVAGPLAGGYLLAGGASAANVVHSMVPFALTAGVAALVLSFVAKPAE